MLTRCADVKILQKGGTFFTYNNQLNQPVLNYTAAQTKHFVRSHTKYRAVASNKMTAHKCHPLHSSSVHYGTATFDNHREQLSQ